MTKRTTKRPAIRVASTETKRPSRSHRASALVVALALTSAGAWAYSTSFAGVFVFDDGLSIVDNPHIKTLWPLTRAMSAPPEATVSGRPVASLTLALNYARAPRDARDVMTPAGPTAPPGAAERYYRNVWGYHALNLAVHLAAALALFGIVRRSLLRTDLRGESTPLAFAVSLIWLVHPLQTQAVTYVVQRVESLMGLFYLLTLYCAIRAAEILNVRTTNARLWTVAAVVACALGMGTKEVMVSAPVMVWLWDRTFRIDPRRRQPLYACLASTWAILLLLVVFEHRPQSVGFNLGWTWRSYLVTQMAVVTHYLRLAIVPVPIVFDYGWPRVRSIADVWPEALLLTGLAGATVVAIVKRHPLGFLGAWLFLILAPTSSVLPIITDVAAEHRMYLPLAAIVAFVVCLVARSAGLSGPRSAALKGPRYNRVLWSLATVSVAAVTLTFAELTRARNRDYWSDEALWVDTIEKRPSNARARVGYGVDLLAAARYGEAERELRTAVSLDESNGRAHMNLGSALCAQGKLSEGIQHLERALVLNPHLNEAYGLLGEAYSGVGKQTLSARYFLRALEVLPDNPFLLNRVAWLFATSSDDRIRNGEKAVELAERATRTIGGENAIVLDTLAAAYAEQNRFEDAADTVRRALTLARAQGQTRFVPELEQHLALYTAGRKARSP